MRIGSEHVLGVAGHVPDDVDPDPALRGVLVDERGHAVVTWSAIFATASRCAGSAPRPVRGEAGRGVTNYFDLRGKNIRV